MRKGIVGFGACLVLLYAGACTVSASKIGQAPSGDVTMMFSSPPRLGQTVSLQATFTPIESGEQCEVIFQSYGGAEIEGGQKTLWDNAGSFTAYLPVGNVEKGKSFQKSVQIKVFRPGVIQFTAGFVYWDAEKNRRSMGGAVLYAVVTEKGSTIYHERSEIPSEAYYISRKIGISFPSEKGKVNIDNMESSKYDELRKKDKTKALFTMYLPKETRLDFDPTYQFKVGYASTGALYGYPFEGNALGVEGLKKLHAIGEQIKQQGHPTWSLKGNIGTLDQTGLFTATKFGKGDICVTDGILKDCIDVEVVPLPNPSPPDRIVSVVTLPYETEEEKTWVKQILKTYAKKKFKSKREAFDFLFKNYKGKKLLYSRVEVSPDVYDDAVVEDGKLLYGKKFPSPEEKKKENIVWKRTVKLGDSLTFYAFGITASGELTDKKSTAPWSMGAGGHKFGGQIRHTDKQTGMTYVSDGVGFGLGEFTFTPEETGMYKLSDFVIEVK